MPRPDRELLELIYKRSSQIRRRRLVARGVSGFLAVGLVAGITTPLALRGGILPPLTPSPSDHPPTIAIPSPPGPTPCSCTAPRPDAPPDQETIPTKVPRPDPPISDHVVLAFASDRDGGWDIYRMRSDGSRVKRLTNHPAPERNPSWSPDGRHIAFVRLAQLGDLVGDIFVMKADGSGARFLTHGGTPKWSPDGRMLAFHRYRSGSSGPLNGEIWVIDGDGTNERMVATDALDASFTPDGRHLVFGGINQGHLPDTTDGRHQITNVTAVSLGGSHRRQITNNPIYACQPAVSPDGRSIAYIAASPDGNVYHLALIDWRGLTEPVVLTHGIARLESTPSWAPDGEAIAIGRDPDGDPHYASMFGILDAQPQPSVIFIVGVNGTTERRITEAGATYNDADPSFRPRAP